MYGGEFLPETTLIEKGGSETHPLLRLPSLTAMAMSAWMPTNPAVGLPYKVPEVESKRAQAGRPFTVKRRRSPFASVAVGRKIYSWPTAAVGGGLGASRRP